MARGEFANFFTGFAEQGDSISAIKEKFLLFVQEVQSLSDYKEFCSINEEYNRLKIEEPDNKDMLKELEIRMNAYKLWWSRLSDNAIKGLSRISDRESRRKETDLTVNHKISLTQIHELMNQAKEVEYYE